MIDTVTQTRADAAQERINAVIEQVNNLNRVKPENVPPFVLPIPQIELAASIDSLVLLLVGAGIVGEQEFLDGKYERMAEIVEQHSGKIAEAKREMLGLHVIGQR
jgi:hypothetical protein